jgi:hypothetical protein
MQQLTTFTLDWSVKKIENEKKSAQNTFGIPFLHYFDVKRIDVDKKTTNLKFHHLKTT